MDVTSLYTYIPHEKGIEACRKVSKNRTNQCPSTESLIQLFEHILKYNGEHYLQNSGTVMETKMAPSYANIFMGRLELSWLRFTDDIELKWGDGSERLNKLIDMANSVHNYIKFTVEIPTSKNTFLDATGTLANEEIEFNLHTKPTDSHLYLMPFGCHPPHTFKGVPKGLVILIRCICSSPTSFQEQRNIL
jgi:hypothetical protein